jgi:DNA-3-methyladenine glycosylase I
LQEGKWTPPNWWYHKKRPPDDDAYFENMSRVIFQTGLNWKVIDKKWPTTKKAFSEFSLEKVSRFTDSDIQRLLKDEGIIRNKGKIEAIIKNAAIFKTIKKECGSFQAYLSSMDKSNNYSAVIEDLTTRFKWLGPPSATLFLHTVGEPMKHTWEM